MSQCDRVLRALRAGPVSPVDFAAPTANGQAPIMRVAARVQDLRDRGYEISTAFAGNGTAVYTLVCGVEQADSVTPLQEASQDRRPDRESSAVGLLGVMDDVGRGPVTPSGPAPLFDPGPFEARGDYRDAA